MTARYGTATCTCCGATFAASRTGYTVRCPECRATGRTKPKAKKYTAIECSRCGTTYTELRCPGCGF